MVCSLWNKMFCVNIDLIIYLVNEVIWVVFGDNG